MRNGVEKWETMTQNDAYCVRLYSQLTLMTSDGINQCTVPVDLPLDLPAKAHRARIRARIILVFMPRHRQTL